MRWNGASHCEFDGKSMETETTTWSLNKSKAFRFRETNIDEAKKSLNFGITKKHQQNILRKIKYGLQKEYSAQNCLWLAIKKWKKIGYESEFGTLLTGLSKTFNWTPNYYRISKYMVFRCMHENPFLTFFKQKTKKSQGLWQISLFTASFRKPLFSWLRLKWQNMHINSVFYKIVRFVK